MIRIQLWKGDNQVGADHIAASANAETGISEEADRVVDQMITDVHAGKHGKGTFRLDADHVGKGGVFMGRYYRGDLTFPFAKKHAAQSY